MRKCLKNIVQGMNAMKKQFVIACLSACLLFPAGASAAEKQVDVTIPTFPVVLHGLTIAQDHNSYPSLLYKNITYVPMTYYDAQLLGLTSVWSQGQGLTIDKAAFVADKETAQQQYQPYVSSSKNGDSYQAVQPDFAITVNGKKIDNSKEEYPLLVFRDVTYFPLTWRFAVDEFGWTYTFDNQTGLVITPATTTAPQTESSAENGTVVIVSGDTVNLRSSAGTNSQIVTQVQKGASLTVLNSGLDQDGALWYQVQSSSGVKAWIASWLVTPQTTGADNSNGSTANNDSETAVISTGTTVYVIGDVVNLRSGAGTNQKQVGQVARGDSLKVTGSSKDNDGKVWYQTQMEDGATVWIASWLVSASKPIGDGNNYTSTGLRTQLELQPVQQNGKKTVISLKNGENNTYSIEKVDATTLQLLLDNVTLGSQTQCQGNGFTLDAGDAGNDQVRVTLRYPLGSYADVEQDGDWLTLSCYQTGSGLAGRTIVLDPGHGGSDPGGQGRTMPDVTDADIGYDVAVYLRDLLEQSGATVIMTREELSRTQKVFMTERIEMNNQVEPDIFISIHANSTENETTATGAESYTYNGKVYSQQYLSVNLAEHIRDGLKTSTAQKSVTKTKNLYVLRMNNHPAVLVECGYLSNPADEQLLATDAYRQKLAQGIYDGVVEYFNQF